MDKPRVSREELAWAAGFFDGEGTFCTRKEGRQCYIVASIYQVDRLALERFELAISGLGKIYGPLVRKQHCRRPFYQWQTNKFEHVQAVIAMLWTFLSPVKREQAKRAMQAWHAVGNHRHARGYPRMVA